MVLQETKKKRLGEILVESGTITEEQLKSALEKQKSTGLKLGELLIREGYVTQEQMIKVLETQLGINSVDLSKFKIEEDAVKMVPEAICRKHTVVGIQASQGYLLIAMKDPLDYFALEDVKVKVSIPVRRVIASEKDINDVIDKYYSSAVAERAVRDFIKQKAPSSSSKIQSGLDVKEDDDLTGAPIVRLINTIIDDAVRNKASDIHIEPDEDIVRVRFRIDGILVESMRLESETFNAISSRIKIMANLNIAEKRIPQDGRIEYSFQDRKIDLRVSTLPTTDGEKIVMRILDKTFFLKSKEELGLTGSDLEKFDRMIAKPYGIIFVTGPTGSGKSSTLYTAINELNDVRRNIITLEDPVEFKIKGINQVNVNTKTGLTFAAGLRSILRQDPDIIMIGEIRDAETAEIAVKAALTGHLVLSTLHTNDAPSSITRIIDMGIEPFLISSSLIGVIAQRLVRKICKGCVEKYKTDYKDEAALKISTKDVPYLLRGKGCHLCGGTGYKGRIAIFEIMEVSDKLRRAIDKGAGSEEIKMVARENGMTTLFDSCRKLVLKGITSVDELIRVTYSV